MSCGNSRSSKCNPCGPSADAMNEIANKAAYYARIAQYASDGFSQVYLGAKDVAPTTDNNGNPLIVGALYFNSTNDTMYVWDGTAWDVATNFNENTPFLSTGSTTTRTLANRFADVVNVKDFGAVGDGVTDDRQNIENAANFAISVNKTLYFPSGNYFINSKTSTSANCGIFIHTDYGISIILDDNATLIAGINLYNQTILGGGRAVIRIERINNVVGESVNFTGGKFDVSNIPIPSGGVGTGGLDCLSIGPKYKKVNINKVVFNHGIRTASGVDFGYGGGDSSIFCKEPENISVTNCSFYGSADLGVYLSGDNAYPTRIGRNAVISDNYFLRCGGAVGIKRYFEKTIISNNHIFECGNGIFTGDTGFSDEGKRVIIIGNTIEKIQGNPILIDNSDSAIVIGNEIFDYRKWISDGTTDTGVSSGNIGGAVKLNGTTNFTINGNVVGFIDWTAPTVANKFAVGISLGTYSVSQGCQNGSVIGNTIKSCYGALYISDDAANIILTPNLCIGNTLQAINNYGTGTNVKSINLLDDIGTGFEWLTDGVFRATSNGNEVARFNADASAVNHLRFNASATGNPPSIQATGTDTFVDLNLLPKGSAGVVRFGTHSTTSDVPITGFITIKDSSGVLRKLAVIA